MTHVITKPVYQACTIEFLYYLCINHSLELFPIFFPAPSFLPDVTILIVTLSDSNTHIQFVIQRNQAVTEITSDHHDWS